MVSSSPEWEIQTCRRCDRKFNLAVQPYFTNVCPDCRYDEKGVSYDGK